jgi:ribonuclease HI
VKPARGASGAYRIYSDGASKGNPGPAGAGAVIRDAEGNTVAEIAEYVGVTTNNVAEYMGLLEALKVCASRDWGPVEVYADSQLLIRQLQGRYRVKNEGIRPLYEQVKAHLDRLGCARLQHIPREENREADRLSNVGVGKGEGL